MKREFSAGGIIFNKEKQVLLINNAALRDPKKSYWGFPKGHIEGKESSKDAAIREVKEETGLEVTVIQKIGDSKYIFLQDKEKIFKVVIMFLMEESGGELKIQDQELLGAEWFSLEEASKKLSFGNDRKLLKKALEIISTY
jgi:8-oxo-dGTP pyrophosphatase MutT (NUDIX family)